MSGNLAREAIALAIDLHAAVAVPAGGQERLEHLCRYVLRPPIAQDSLALSPDGRVVLTLRRPGETARAHSSSIPSTSSRASPRSRPVHASTCSSTTESSLPMRPIGERRWRAGAAMIGTVPALITAPATRTTPRRRTRLRSPAAEMAVGRIASRSRARAAAPGSAGPTSCAGCSRSTPSSALFAAGACASSPRSTTRM